MNVRILGVDPGLTRCGIGVIESLPGRQVRLVAVDVIRTAADMAPEQRLLRMTEAFESWIAEHRPDAVAVERVFAQHNVRTVTGTSQVAGLAMVAATRASIPVALHTPSEVKAAVTGSGRAEKAQVQEMVRRILGLVEAPSPADAADALAIAITHGWRGVAAVVPMVGNRGQTAAQRAWAEAAAGSGARAQAARRRLAR
ncbi:crossover junction endodeoxyribonuclease RuvC [Pseudactinotalea terrae]|uniref:crossover junction endodeoxyribonuclease RuvC n=1 Tax=Pseudactinotalea terrae TaxID=1743262 RepID=UPI0012E12648|nr:crossover junction endodeoxyribonuclease RuvC [Pseudactinotalea terrae]